MCRLSAVRYGTDVRLFLRISAAPVPAETETGDLSEHKAMFTYTRDFTSLENGMAKEGSLRQCRCVKSGFHFYGTCVCDAQDAELVIKWVGTMRNRGFGEVSICVEDQHE